MVTSTLADIRQQIAELQQREADIFGDERQHAIGKINELIEQYDVKPAQIKFPSNGRGPKTSASPSQRLGVGVAKYKDPASGKTWTGFGKPPGWIAGVEDRNAFLITNVAAEAATPVTAHVAAAKKAAPVKKAVPSKKAPPSKKAAKTVPAKKVASKPE